MIFFFFSQTHFHLSSFLENFFLKRKTTVTQSVDLSGK